MAAGQAGGEIRGDLSPEWIVRALHALVDGLQTAWLIDPTVDMAADVEEFLRLLRISCASPDHLALEPS